MPRQPGCVKTGGRGKGVPNKPKPIKLSDTPENRQLALMAPTLAKQVRTPKSIMLDAMMRFDDLSIELMEKAKRMAKSGRPLSEITEVMAEGYRFTIAAVQCAEKCAPYIHPRLMMIESRGDLTDTRVPFVLRAPAVMENSAEWQAVASQQGVVLDQADRAAVRETLQERWREVQATRQPPVENNDPRTSGERLESMPSGSAGSGAPPPAPMVLVADQNTSRITAMPVGPVVLKPAGSEEWLTSIKLVR